MPLPERNGNHGQQGEWVRFAITIAVALLLFMLSTWH